MNSESIKAQYRVLGELRRVDEKALRLQLDVDRIPQEIARLDEALATRKATLDRDRAGFDGAEKMLRQAELTLKEREDSMRKAESKMMEVKTNEEYQAALKENATQKDEKGKLEEKTITMQLEIDGKRAAFKELEKGHADYQAKLTEEKKTLDGERAKLVVLLAEQKGKREELLKQLDPTIATLYQRLSARFKGSIIAGVANETCLGCNMKVRPQMYNEIIAFKKIYPCPCSQKILIPLSAETEENPMLGK